VPVEYITPKEGRLGWVCGFALSAKSQNVDLAYDYLDAVIAPEPMAYLSNEYGYGAASAGALPLTDPAFVDLFHLDDPGVLDTTVFYRPLTEAQREAFTGAWSEIQAAP
jgi:spermidine/putrescine transport system substrate-binding protein